MFCCVYLFGPFVDHRLLLCYPIVKPCSLRSRYRLPILFFGIFSSASMAFKGAWHRGDGAGSSTSGDRRYPSGNDSYNSFSLPPQGMASNQMGLAPMNYPNNPNAMYSGMNSVSRYARNAELTIRVVALGSWDDGPGELLVRREEPALFGDHIEYISRFRCDWQWNLLQTEVGHLVFLFAIQSMTTRHFLVRCPVHRHVLVTGLFVKWSQPKVSALKHRTNTLVSMFEPSQRPLTRVVLVRRCHSVRLALSFCLSSAASCFATDLPQSRSVHQSKCNS